MDSRLLATHPSHLPPLEGLGEMGGLVKTFQGSHSRAIGSSMNNEKFLTGVFLTLNLEL